MAKMGAVGKFPEPDLGQREKCFYRALSTFENKTFEYIIDLIERNFDLNNSIIGNRRLSGYFRHPTR